MSVAAHLGIRLGEYDAVIRSLIPHYTALLDAAAAAVDVLLPSAPVVVDLGTGSGALAKRILGVRPRAQVIGIDADAGMLAMARQRLPAGAFTPMVGDFERMEIPACNLVSASFALHHVRSLKAKAVLYRKLHAALKRGGTLVSADSFLASDRRLQAVHRAAWLSHLQRRYSPRRAQQFLADWAEEDYYVPLEREMELLRAAGFSVEVVWRRDGFATVAARR